jgi:type II secretory pathway pseudopilin PulG
MRRGKAGFTMIEAVVSAGLIAVGAASAIRGFGALTKGDIAARDHEQMQRLAIQKYEELVSTGTLGSASSSGDFSDWNNNDYVWKMDVIASGATNLDQIRVIVSPRNDSKTSEEVDGLRYRPPTTTGGSTQ